MNTALPQRVLAIGAHPDDCELLCGGTLARFAHGGAHVTVCSVARGDKGHRSMPPDELARVRRDESLRAAAVIGAESLSLDLPDGTVLDTSELRQRVVELVRRVRPDLVLTHSPNDYHPDHQGTARLVTAASWFAASPGHSTDAPALTGPVPVYYMDTVAGLDFQPTEYVDISGVLATKEEMLRCHASQLDAMAQHGESDLAALMRDQARLRGRQCGVAYAEGFRPCLKWKRVRPYRLLPQ